jgi:hypothetical protein
MQDQRKEFREQAMYDISKTYALNGKAKESIEYLDEVI